MTILNDDITNPQQSNFESETKPLDHIILQAIRNNLVETRTAFPAQITKVVSTNYVNIQPMLKRQLKSGKIVKLPEIYNVPVIMPQNGTYFIKLPMAVGDTGLALVSERSLDAWKQSGGIVDPQDVRIHNLSDATFLPGLYPTTTPILAKGASADLELVNGLCQVVMKPNGKVQIGNGTVELINLIDQLFALFDATTVNTMLGPQPFLNIANYDTLRTQFDLLKV